MNIDEAAKLLIVREPFYGLFLLNIPRIATESAPTIQVAYYRNGTAIEYNPEWWNKWDKDTQLNLLRHELTHIMYNHMTMSDDFENSDIFGIAADLEINGDLSPLPPEGVFVENFGFPKNKGTAWYYEQLTKPNDGANSNTQPEGSENTTGQDGTSDGENTEPNNKDGESDGQNSGSLGDNFDNHSTWETFRHLTEAEQQLVEQHINQALIESWNNLSNASRGTVPGNIVEKIKKLLEVKPRIFNWTQFLRRFLGNQWSIELKKTHRKESRRFEDSMGTKHRKVCKLLIAIDTSGSVDSVHFKDFFCEIDYAVRNNISVDIMDFDAHVQRVYPYKYKMDVEVHGRGGTDFQPVIDFFESNNHEYQALGIFTDGGAPIPNSYSNNIVWVITPDGEEKDFPGTVIKIPKNNG